MTHSQATSDPSSVYDLQHAAATELSSACQRAGRLLAAAVLADRPTLRDNRHVATAELLLKDAEKTGAPPWLCAAIGHYRDVCKASALPEFAPSEPYGRMRERARGHLDAMRAAIRQRGRAEKVANEARATKPSKPRRSS